MRLALEALDMAIETRDPPKGLIHHSDRGVQYACTAYAKRLAERGIEPSMSRPGNPYDNAKAESFMKTLKAEEANGQTYANLSDARLHRSRLQRQPPPFRARIHLAHCLRGDVP